MKRVVGGMPIVSQAKARLVSTFPILSQYRINDLRRTYLTPAMSNSYSMRHEDLRMKPSHPNGLAAKDTLYCFLHVLCVHSVT